MGRCIYLYLVAGDPVPREEVEVQFAFDNHVCDLR